MYSLAVSWFDPVTVEFAVGFGLLRSFELAQVFGLAVRKPLGVGALLALPALGLLPNGSKIDKLSHSRPRR
jgi:hypothetical protein